jgi:hypothetical protein
MTRNGANFPLTGPTRRILLGALAVALLAGVATARVTVQTATGLSVTIHEADDIAAEYVVQRDGRTWLEHPTAGAVALETTTHPWSTLAPVSAADVAAALRSVSGFETDVALDVFLLPGLPAEILGSFARGGDIFMAPGLAPQAAETIAWLVTHELGHVLCNAAVDPHPARWAEYRALRGLDPDAVDADLPHAQRHREIIAEDFRALFGGPLATRSGTIENPDLPLPGAVDGLRDLLVSYLADPRGGPAAAAPVPTASRAFPNPSRGATTVELDLPAGDKVAAGTTVLEIYDLRGRLVRRLERGRVSAGRVQVRWDGTDGRGRGVADGVYLYRIGGGGVTAQGQFLVAR